MAHNSKKMQKAIFISFEGVEGCGKTTQAKLLYNYLKEEGIEIIYTAEPGGTVLCNKIRELVLGLDCNESIEPYTEFFLFMASRVQHVKHIILPALEAGKWVICDRFIDSTVVYQGIVKKIASDAIAFNHKSGVSNLMPDITFLIDISHNAAYNRVLNRNSKGCNKGNRFDNETLDFYKRIRDGFIETARKENKRIKVISSSDTIERTHNKILQIIKNYYT